MITKRKFLSAVRKEIIALKKHAAPEEIARLDFSKLDPTNPILCIYGQMTGVCHSRRAEYLKRTCAVVEFHYVPGFEPSIATFLSMGHRLTGVPEFTHLEVYICTKNARNANVIAFLKGETTKFRL